jgi:hypothetical protein
MGRLANVFPLDCLFAERTELPQDIPIHDFTTSISHCLLDSDVSSGIIESLFNFLAPDLFEITD